MQLALNESNDVPNFNIKEKMDPWTKLKHYPVIKVMQEKTNVSNHINIKIFLENVNAINRMVGIPLSLTLFQGYSINDKNMPFWLSPQFAQIDNIILFSLGNESFTIVNKLQAGEYKQFNSLCI